MADEETSGGRLKVLKKLSEDWAEPRRSAMEWLSEETIIPKDRLKIWKPTSWGKMRGRVTLAGDAARAMTFPLTLSYSLTLTHPPTLSLFSPCRIAAGGGQA